MKVSAIGVKQTSEDKPLFKYGAAKTRVSLIVYGDPVPVSHSAVSRARIALSRCSEKMRSDRAKLDQVYEITP